MKITEKLKALGIQMTNGSNVFKEEKLEGIFGENYQEQMYHSDSKYISFYYLFFEEEKEMYYIHFYKVPTLNDSKIFQFIGNSAQLYSKVNGEVIDEMLQDEEKAQARLLEKNKTIANNQKKLKDQLSDSLFYELFKEDVRIQKELERKLALIKKVTDHPSVRLKKLFNPRGGMENEKR